MLSYSSYKKRQLTNQLAECPALTGVQIHFDILRYDLLEALKLNLPLLEQYDRNVNDLVQLIGEEDYSDNKQVVEDIVSWCKENFNDLLQEAIDFDSFLKKGPAGIDKLDNIQQLKTKIKWAIDEFVKQVKQMVLSPVVANRAAPAPSVTPPATATPSAAPRGPRANVPPPDDFDVQPATHTAAQAPVQGPSKGSFWTRKAKSPLGKLLWNVPRSAAAGAWKWLKNKYQGEYLDDSVRAYLVNLIETTFLENENKILDTIDQFAASLLTYINQNIDDYVKSVTGSTTTTPTTPTPGSPSGSNPTGPTPTSPPAGDKLVPGVNAMEPRALPGAEGENIPISTKLRRAAPVRTFPSEAEFDDAIKSGKYIDRFALINRAKNLGLTPEPGQEGESYEHRLYNAFRKQMGLSPLSDFPSKPITPDELEKLRGMSEEQLKEMGASTTKNKDMLRRWARLLHIPVPGRKKGNVQSHVDLGAEVFKKLQEPGVLDALVVGEAPKKETPAISKPEIAPEATPEAPKVPDSENPTVLQARPLPGASTGTEAPKEKKSYKDLFADILGRSKEPEFEPEIESPESEPEAQKEPAATTPEAPAVDHELEARLNKVLQDIKHEFPNVNVQSPKIKDHVRSQLQSGEDEGSIIDRIGGGGGQKSAESQPVPESEPQSPLEEPKSVENPKKEPLSAPTGNDDLGKRTKSLHHEIGQVAEKLVNGIDTPDGRVALRNAQSATLGEDEIAKVLEDEAAKKGGLANVSDDDAYEAAMRAFEEKYLKNNPDMVNKRDLVKDRINQIVQSGTSSQEKAPESDDFSKFIEDEPTQESPEPANEKESAIFQAIPPELSNNVPKDQLHGMIGHLLSKNPDASVDSVARRVMDMIKVYSQTESIYQGLNPEIKSQGSEGEIKGMIGEMLTAKLGKVKPDQIPLQLENALFKKKVSGFVDQVIKKIDFKGLTSIFGSEKAAKAEVYRQLADSIKGGDDPKTAVRFVTLELQDMIEKESSQKTPKKLSEKPPEADDEGLEKDPALKVQDELRSENISDTPRVSFFQYLLNKVFDNDESKLRSTIETELHRNNGNVNAVVKNLIDHANEYKQGDADPFSFVKKPGQAISLTPPPEPKEDAKKKKKKKKKSLEDAIRSKEGEDEDDLDYNDLENY